ncbi:polynucleotide kinase-phosphatase [Parachryseolinea silvisoli]|uniref:polynucleotide kinase-phosphatase n=1 Tax=Parachryseolinea silvisoli TaxID=2873601 RepID=UPI00226588E7|nr:polynucleotide kinase-phosphatase [Parachryseolinea silvisoli]MCD9016643.1 polynucleotide kinase-phosphatase [Parachryseolinea silvisoli]
METRSKELKIPELSLVMLIGVSGSGKSTFAKKHFKETEIASSDRCRAIVSDDENKQEATDDAFALLHYIAARRLKNGLLTVVDAINVQPESRASLVRLAREYHCIPVAIVLDVPERVCEARNAQRPDRNFGGHVLYQQRSQLKRSLRKLKDEGFRHIHVLKSTDEIEAISHIAREKLYNDRKELGGPFDIIGDIHGCFDELMELLTKLGYAVVRVAVQHRNFGFQVIPPAGRTVVFLGDLVDRGPKSPDVLRLVMSMVHAGTAFCVPGNHDIKLHKYLQGKNVQVQHGLEKTVEQLAQEDDGFRSDVKEFLYDLVSHYVFDRGRLVVAHAGLKEEMQGRGSGVVRTFCLYGETTGEIDEFGLPVRYNWALEYRGKAMVVYGHTPVPEAQWLNRTIDIDTGCVFGGKLTALRYPEEELVSVQAKQVYETPVRPIDFELHQQMLTHQQSHDDVLDIEDVTGKRIIATRLRNNVTVKEENSIAALEVMSRFAINPKWLIYLPPTMSPSEASELEAYLEHPVEALQYFRSQGIEKVICEEKHMGSRAVLIVGKDEEAIRSRFGVEHEGIGVCYTRTGRNFFNDPRLEKEFLLRVNQALTTSGFWDTLNTDWVCLDAELMPWSVKAQALLKDQYAAVGTAATASLRNVVDVLGQTASRNIDGIEQLLSRFQQKQDLIDDYKTSYHQYCWPVNAVDDLTLAPFHILATEGAVHTDKSHAWHMNTIQVICDADPALFLATTHKIIDVFDDGQVDEVVHWWTNLTGQGGEGMVIKPYDFVAIGRKGLVQPAIKCRGKEYLRIIYGPEYTEAENLDRLRNRNLSFKRSLALREFALGVEALERFVRKDPLRKVHECVFAVLALESEEVDPRL